MSNFNIYLIVSPEEMTVDGNKLIIKKKLPYHLNVKEYEVAMTEFTTSYLKGFFTLAISDMIPCGITFKNIIGYLTTKIDIIDDWSELIEEQINSLVQSYFYFIYENMYHNLNNITKIPSEKSEIYFISNTNSDEIAVYSKIGDITTGYFSKSKADELKAAVITSNKSRKELDRVIIKEYTTYFDKEFMSKNFEDYTTLELTKFYENYLEKIPDEFRASKIIITAKKHNKVNYHTSYSLRIKIKDKNNNPRPKFTLVETEQEILLDKELMLRAPRMNALLFESDIVPLQYVNNQLKNVLKIINYGMEMNPYEIKDYYLKVTRPFINTINITITSYSNLIFPESVLLKDYIYINLHFKKFTEEK